MILPKSIQSFLYLSRTTLINMFQLNHRRLNFINLHQLLNHRFKWENILFNMNDLILRLLWKVLPEFWIHSEFIVYLKRLEIELNIECLLIVLDFLKQLNIFFVEFSVQLVHDVIDIFFDYHICNHIFHQVFLNVILLQLYAIKPKNLLYETSSETLYFIF